MELPRGSGRSRRDSGSEGPERSPGAGLEADAWIDDQPALRLRHSTAQGDDDQPTSPRTLSRGALGRPGTVRSSG